MAPGLTNDADLADLMAPESTKSKPAPINKHPDLQRQGFPTKPKFDDPYKERDYLKGRLAAAFRIFGKYGFDEGVAGHITLRVSFSVATNHQLDVLTPRRIQLSRTLSGSIHLALLSP